MSDYPGAHDMKKLKSTVPQNASTNFYISFYIHSYVKLDPPIVVPPYPAGS